MHRRCASGLVFVLQYDLIRSGCRSFKWDVEVEVVSPIGQHWTGFFRNRDSRCALTVNQINVAHTAVLRVADTQRSGEVAVAQPIAQIGDPYADRSAGYIQRDNVGSTI